MTHFNIISIAFLSSISPFINHVSAMEIESIVGGYPAPLYTFTYQVAIVTKENYSKSLNLVCSGAIVAKNLILTAAQCFVDDHGNLKAYEYSIITDTNNWRLIKGIEVLIDLIYLPSGGNYYLNDIAVAQLHDDLNIVNNTHLTAIDIPQSNESFWNKIGTVSGYGHIYSLRLYNSGRLRELINDLAGLLKFSMVKITNNTLCAIGNTNIHTNKQFCGLMLSNIPDAKWGICENDAGSPLVFQNQIVGVAGKNHENCDDSVFGIAYTKVSTYSHFINSIINGTPLPNTLIHENRKHMLHMAAAAA